MYSFIQKYPKSQIETRIKNLNTNVETVLNGILCGGYIFASDGEDKYIIYPDNLSVFLCKLTPYNKKICFGYFDEDKYICTHTQMMMLLLYYGICEDMVAEFGADDDWITDTVDTYGDVTLTITMQPTPFEKSTNDLDEELNAYLLNVPSEIVEKVCHYAHRLKVPFEYIKSLEESENYLKRNFNKIKKENK